MSPRAAPARIAVLSVPDGTGNPRLPSHTRTNASQAPPSRGWHVASCRTGTPSGPVWWEGPFPVGPGPAQGIGPGPGRF